jgi:hypothetical protein
MQTSAAQKIVNRLDVILTVLSPLLEKLGVTFVLEAAKNLRGSIRRAKIVS